MLEKRSRNAMACTPLVATRQDAHLGPIVEGVLYGWWHGYAYTSVSRAFLFASWQALGKPFVTDEQIIEQKTPTTTITLANLVPLLLFTILTLLAPFNWPRTASQFHCNAI